MIYVTIFDSLILDTLYIMGSLQIYQFGIIVLSKNIVVMHY